MMVRLRHFLAMVTALREVQQTSDKALTSAWYSRMHHVQVGILRLQLVTRHCSASCIDRVGQRATAKRLAWMTRNVGLRILVVSFMKRTFWRPPPSSPCRAGSAAPHASLWNRQGHPRRR